MLTTRFAFGKARARTSTDRSLTFFAREHSRRVASGAAIVIRAMAWWAVCKTELAGGYAVMTRMILAFSQGRSRRVLAPLLCGAGLALSPEARADDLA